MKPDNAKIKPTSTNTGKRRSGIGCRGILTNILHLLVVSRLGS